MSGTANSPAGWYDDPNDPRLERFWDGNAWTNTAQPRANIGVTKAAPQDADTLTATSPAVSVAVIDEDPPPWAAEVVEAEAANASATPRWQRPKLFAAAAVVGLAAIVLLSFALTRGDSSATNTEGPGRAIFTETADGDTSATTSTAPADEAADETPTTTEASSTSPTTTEQADAASTSSSIPEAAAAADVLSAATAAENGAEEAGDTADAAETTPEEETNDAANNDVAPAAADTTATTVAPETPTTTAAAAPTTTAATGAATVDGVSAACLEAVQAAADIDDRPPEAIHPAFDQCSTEDEWLLAAEATGIADQVDIDTWVSNECIYNVDLYTSALCTATISADSGPRRISCGDGRADIEWPFADDPQTNDEVCANHFQIECPAGVFHNIPVEAMSEEEASAALCA